MLGIHNGSANDISQIIRELRLEFPQGSYDLLNKNCNTFSNEFCKRVLDGLEIPKWVNRLAGIGGFVSSMGLPITQQVEARSAATTSQASSDDGKKKKELTEKQKSILGIFKKGKESS